MGLMQQMFSGIPTTSGAPTPPVTSDSLFNYVNMLLSGNVMSGSATIISDSSANNMSITPTGNVTNNPFTPFNSQYYSTYFSANTDYLSVPASAFNFGTGDFTFEFWYFTSTFANTGDHLDLSFDNGTWQTGVSGTGLNFEKYGSGWAYFILPNAAITNRWTHIAITRQSGTLRGFVNGALVVTAANKTDNLSGGAGTINRRAGTSPTDKIYFSNIRTVIGSAVYTGNFTVPTSPLSAIAGTALLTCQSPSFIDNSGNALAVTVNGLPKVSTPNPFIATFANTYGSGLFSAGTYLTTESIAALALGTGDFTIECWAYHTGFSTSGNSVFEHNAQAAYTSSSLSLLIGAANIQVYRESYFANIAYTTKLSAWYHYAMVRSAGTLTVYVNGVSVYTFAAPTSYTATNMSIGRAAGAASTDMLGYISNLRVVKSAVYTSNFTPSALPLTAISNTALLTLQNNIAYSNNSVIDSGAFGLTMTRNGTMSQSTFSPFSPTGWCGYFNGTSDGLSIPDNVAFQYGTGNFTIELWVYRTSTTATQSVIYQGAGGTNYQFRFGINWNGTTYTYGLSSTGSSGDIANFLSMGTDPGINKWVHLAIVRNGNTFTPYINGVAGTTATSSLAINNAGTPPPLTIGNALTSIQFFGGYISNVRIVKGAAVYTSNFTPSTTPLTAIANTSLLTLQSNRFADNSTNNFTISTIGVPTAQALSPFEPTSAWSPTAVGGSMLFNGANDYLTPTNNTPFVFSTNDFTIEFWMYKNTNGVEYGLYDARATATANEMLIRCTTGDVMAVGSQSNTTLILGTKPIKAGQWFHIVVARYQGNTKLFVNGVQDGATLADSTSWTCEANRPTIGCVGYTLGAYLNGYMSNVKVVNGKALYTTTFTPPTMPTTPDVNTVLLLNGTSQGVYDSAGKLALTLVGTPRIATSVNKYGAGSIYFNGSTDYVYVDTNGSFVDAPNGGDITVEMWVKPSSLAAAGTLYDTSAAGDTTATGRLLIQYSTAGAINVRTDAGTTNLGDSTAGALVAGSWSHIAVVRSAGVWKIYANGVLVSTPVTNAFTLLGKVDRPVIGANAYNYSVKFNGYMSGIRVTKAARYTTNFTPPTTTYPTY